MAEPLTRENQELSIENRQNEESDISYLMGDEEKAVVSKVFDMFRASADNRNRNFKYLDNRNIIEYINDSVGRFFTNYDERSGIEDWQARVNVPMTHNKVTAVLGKIVGQLPMAEVNPRTAEDSKRAQILNDLYQYSEDADDYDELMICAALEAIVKGTVVGFEGFEHKTKKVRNVTGYDNEGFPKMKEETVNESRLYGSIVPLEQFYPSSVGVRRVEDMPYAFRRYTIPYSSFVSQFSCYPRYANVQPKVNLESDETAEDVPFYRDFMSMDVEDGNVEVIEYYNKDTDEYVLMANGVWINPLKDWTVAPNPFNHKRLPFWSARFDTLGSDFFYGKSLVDRMSAMQDVLNVLTNMLLDQSFLTIFPPMLTAGIDPVEEDYLRPGRRVPVDTQGLPLNQTFMKLDLGVPSGWHQFILSYTEKVMSESSVDQVASGVAGVGGRTTAEEIRVAAAGVAAILGIFGKLLNLGIKNKALLRCGNILQFWTDKKYPIAQAVLGDNTGIFNEAFNVVSVDNARLSNGKNGKKVIGIFDNAKSLPSASEVRTSAKIYEKTAGHPVEIHAVTSSYLRNLKYDIKLVPNLKSNDTKEVQKALVLEKTRVYLSFFPQEVNRGELQAQLAEIFGDDASKMFTPPKEQAPAEDGGTQKAQTEPQADISNNMVRQMMGGETGDMQMRDMAA